MGWGEFDPLTTNPIEKGKRIKKYRFLHTIGYQQRAPEEGGRREKAAHPAAAAGAQPLL